MDLSKLSDKDFDALEASGGDLSVLSDEGFAILESQDRGVGNQPTPKQPYSPEETALSRGIQPGPMTAFPGESYGFANRQIPIEAKRQVMGNAVKYGLPIAASFATAGALPATLGAIKAGAVISGASGLTGFISELLGQDIKGEERSYRKAVSEGVLQALPTRNSGSLFKRLLFNVPSTIVTTEVSEYVRDGDEYSLPSSEAEAFSRWGAEVALSGGASYFGLRGSRVRSSDSAVETLGRERQGGSVTVGERVPEFAELERKVLRKGNEKAQRLMDNMDMGFDESLPRAFPNAPEGITDIGAYLNQAKTSVATARKEFEVAQKAATQAREKANVLASGDNIRAYEAARTEANQLALISQSKRLAAESVERNVLGVNPLNVSDVGFAKQVQGVNNTIAAAKSSLSDGINDAYKIADIRPNTVVVSRKGVNNSISSRSKSGSAFEGDISRQESRDLVNAYFDEFGVDGLLTLEGMQGLKGNIAGKLVQAGKDPNAANRIARELYASVSSSSDRFIKKTMPGFFKNWQRAQSLSARDFALRETPAMEMLSKGDAAGFYSAMAKEGNGETLEAIRTYSQLLKDVGQGEAAGVFMSNVNQVIARGVLFKAAQGRVGTGIDSLSDAIDPLILLKEVDSLRAYKFPVEDLGLGTVKQIKGAARLASVKSNGIVTKGDYEEYLSLAADVGESKAVARMNYYNAVRDEQLSNGTSQARNASYRSRQAAKAAGATEEDKLYALTRLNEDPLVRLVEDPTFKVPTASINSAQFANHIKSLEPKTAKAFVQALEDAGKGGDLHNLRKGLSYSVFAKKKRNPDGEMVIDTEGIIDFFTPKGNAALDNQREAFRAVVGDRVYNSMVRNIVDPLRRIQGTRIAASQHISVKLPAATLRTNQFGQQESSLPRMAIVGTFSELKSLLDSGRYYTLYQLYANPRFADEWSMVMRGASTLEEQPVLATAIRLAQLEDEEAQRPALRPNAPQ